MELSRPWQLLRDTLAIIVTGIFMFPMFWWALTSIKPMDAIFDKDRIIWFDFVPTLVNYAVTLLGLSRSQMAIEQGFGMGVTGDGGYDSRRTILDSIVVSIGSTAITMLVATTNAHKLKEILSLLLALAFDCLRHHARGRF